jgi:N6-adenosine-specific RNA methylase IME4
MEDDSVLFLWRLASMQAIAIRICEAWGFRPYGELVWRKLTATGKPWFGMGTIVRGSHETCLIGVRGRLSKLKPLAHLRSVFEAKVTGHSRKPEEFYRLVEALYPDGPYVELFARQHRPRWACYGLELAAARAQRRRALSNDGR